MLLPLMFASLADLVFAIAETCSFPVLDLAQNELVQESAIHATLRVRSSKLPGLFLKMR